LYTNGVPSKAVDDPREGLPDTIRPEGVLIFRSALLVVIVYLC